MPKLTTHPTSIEEGWTGVKRYVRSSVHRCHLRQLGDNYFLYLVYPGRRKARLS